jgi:hypothetical protein
MLANKFILSFCESYLEIDYQEAWVNFVQHPETAEAQAPFRSFLHNYVEASVRICVVLDSREYAPRRMVNSASSLTEVWRRLVASADHHIIRQKRRDEPSRSEQWKLRWVSEDEGKREGPTYLMVKVGQPLMPEKARPIHHPLAHYGAPY